MKAYKTEIQLTREQQTKLKQTIVNAGRAFKRFFNKLGCFAKTGAEKFKPEVRK